MKISTNWLRAVISVTAIGTIVLRVFMPELKIDTVTLALMAIAILPWMSELIESAKFPGGWEIKFRDVQNAGEKITSIGLTKEQPRAQDESVSSFSVVAEHDPNLALVGLRIEVEQRLRRIGERHGIANHLLPLTKLLRELRQREILPIEVVSGLDELVISGNRAAHGAKVEPRVADWAISYGPKILATLDDLQ